MDSLHQHDSKKIREITRTYLESNVVIPHTNFELLFPDNILLWPFWVVFSVLWKKGFSLVSVGRKSTGGSTNLMISLDSTMRLSSFTTSGPTHTIKRESRNENNQPTTRLKTEEISPKTHSLFESNYHSDNSSCSHIATVHASTQIQGTRARACQNDRCCWNAKAEKWCERNLGNTSIRVHATGGGIKHTSIYMKQYAVSQRTVRLFCLCFHLR